VVPLPAYTALRGQDQREHDWDVWDCSAEAGYHERYSPGDSPLANLFHKLFFWGGVGASVGGLITGFPFSVGAGPATDGLIAGAGAGGIAGGVESLSGQPRFERAYSACMLAKGYGPAPRGDKAEAAPAAAAR
jgi:hypothetical protein